VTEYGLCDEQYVDWYSGEWVYNDLIALLFEIDFSLSLYSD